MDPVVFGRQSPLVVWQAAIALVFVVLNGCQNLEERSFIPLTQWEKNTQVSAREANLILQLLALCIVDTQFLPLGLLS